MVETVIMYVVCLAALLVAGYCVYDGIKMIKKAGGFRKFDKELEDWLSK